MKKFMALLVVLCMALLMVTPVMAESEATETAEDNAAPEVEDVNSDEEDSIALESEMTTRLEGVEESESIAATGEVETNEDVLNILLIGSDERTRAFSDNARGDTCMLFSINLKTGAVKLVSFERGIGIQIPEGQYEGQWDWLTHTFKYGGADMVVREIRENFKVDVTKYVRVNLHTFVQLIDAIGGVDIELTSAEARYLNENAKILCREIGLGGQAQKVHAGMNHLNGATAMVYVRIRAIDSDWRRIERQRKVIIAAIGGLMQLGPTEMAAVAIQLMPLVQTNITMSEALTIASAASNVISGETDQMTIPAAHTYGSKKGMGGRSMYSVDFEQNAELLHDFLYGEAD